MSQDSQKCPKCGKPSGYDDRKVYWGDGDLYLCGQCKQNLINRFAAFLGIGGASNDDSGIIIPWGDMERILGSIKRDRASRTRYIVADKEFYNRLEVVTTSVLEG